MGLLIHPSCLLAVLFLSPAGSATDPTDILTGQSFTTVSGTHSEASTTPATDSAASLGQAIGTTATPERTGLTTSKTSNLSASGTSLITETSRVAVFHHSPTSGGSTSTVSSSQATTHRVATLPPDAENTTAPSRDSAAAHESPAAPAECCPPTVTPPDGSQHTQTDVQPTQPHNNSLTMVAFGMMSFILILIVITVILVSTVNLKGRCGTPTENGKKNSDSVVSESNVTTNGEKESITLVSIKTINAETDSDRASSAPGTTLDIGDGKVRQDLLNSKLV